MRVSKQASLCTPPSAYGTGFQNVRSAHRIFVAVFRTPPCPHNPNKEQHQPRLCLPSPAPHLWAVTPSVLPPSPLPFIPRVRARAPRSAQVAFLPPFSSPLGSSPRSSDCATRLSEHLHMVFKAFHTLPLLISSPALQPPCPCPLGAFSHLHSLVYAGPSVWNALYPPCLTGRILFTLINCYHRCVVLLSHSTVAWGPLLGSRRPLYFPLSSSVFPTRP